MQEGGGGPSGVFGEFKEKKKESDCLLWLGEGKIELARRMLGQMVRVASFFLCCDKCSDKKWFGWRYYNQLLYRN